jgi:MFS family permease
MQQEHEGEIMSSTAYRYYVLGLLMIIYAFNFLDRSVVTILAPYLKEDLGISDAQIGLLYGTAFALFYAVFGLPLAKLADGWSRVKTISLGLGFWSLMTAVSGMAGSYAQLGAARIGVGVGEASASPASYSLLQDYFPKRMRATILALYASGIYIGSGASTMFGSQVIKYWETHYTNAPAPFGLSGWQATYLVFGIPGLFLALLMLLTVREPVRGEIDGLPAPGDPHPFRSVMREFSAMLPPWNWRGLKADAADTRPLAGNVVLLVGLALVAWLTIIFTDGLLKPEKRPIVGSIGGFALTTNMVQWTAIAVGIYCSASWVQSIRLRDKPAYTLIANRGFIALTLLGGLMSYISYGLAPFVFLYIKGHFNVGAEVGLTLGIITAVAGGIGATFGGILADFLKRRHPAGRMLVMLIAAICSATFLLLSLKAETISGFFWIIAFQIGLHIMWLGPCAASIQDLVLPRMRGTATAVFFLGTTVLGLGVGPYVVGLVSDVTHDLRFAMTSTLLALPLIVICVVIAARSVPALEASLLVRAQAAGEAV